MSTERRCPACGALVAPDAEWCGQCLRRLTSEADGAATATPDEARTPADDAAAVSADGAEATWTCPTCGEVNGFAANACGVCGTPFGRLFEQPPELPAIAPVSAALWSLVFPGLGHWRAGRHADGVARGVLGLWVLGTLVVLLGSAGEGGSVGLVALIALYGVSTVGLWLVTAVDAARAASGDPPVLSSRVLLWGSVGVIVLSMVLATVIAIPALNQPPSGPTP